MSAPEAAETLASPQPRGVVARLKRVTRRTDFRHASILTTGSVVAQVFLVATAPILARLYTPADFGLLASFIAVCTIAGAIAALCYEVSIIVPRSERAARSLFSLSLYLCLILGGVASCVSMAVSVLFPSHAGQAGGFAMLIGPAIILTALFNILGYAHSRAGQYWSISASKVNQSLFPALCQIALGLLRQGAFGLLLGRVIGLLATILILAFNLPKNYRIGDALGRSFREIAAAARSYKDFTLHVPRQLLVRGSAAVTPILLLGSFGAAPAGLFFFAQRLVERPGALLGDALSRVPMRQFAKRRAEGKPLARASILYTIVCAAPLFLGVLVLTLLARPLFRILFGVQWIEAADYAVVMAVWAAVRMASIPVSMLITVLRVQRASLVLDAAFSLRVLIIPLVAAMGGTALEAIRGFVILSVVYHVFVFSLGMRAAWTYDKSRGGK